MPRMSERGEKRVGAGCAIGLVLLLLCLPVLYVLSTGPVLGLHWRGYLPAEVLAIYAPLQWAAKSCEPLYEFLTWYKNLFRPAVTLS
jgi:hypothetical protein